MLKNSKKLHEIIKLQKMRIALFYGSDTGSTEDIANLIVTKVGKDNIDLYDIATTSPSDFDNYSHIIIGTSTWYDGDLQSEWEEFFPNLDDIDFRGKTVALFGLGDQYGYAEFFVDGIGMIYDKIIKKGARVVGHWPANDYDFEESKAERDGMFVGLAIDEDHERSMTDERLDTWLAQIKPDFDF